MNVQIFVFVMSQISLVGPPLNIRFFNERRGNVNFSDDCGGGHQTVGDSAKKNSNIQLEKQEEKHNPEGRRALQL